MAETVVPNDQPSRDLDFAVARAMGIELQQLPGESEPSVVERTVAGAVRSLARVRGYSGDERYLGDLLRFLVNKGWTFSFGRELDGWHAAIPLVQVRMRGDSLSVLLCAVIVAVTEAR